ncbi:DUF937 domain-containing protein [Roseiarcaceae bacterium H3SJ34-1]|uniref:DUF937 domain-containing protein n=1 Tax=Terripilifer ovatus TaxID=3032367 RepID=UPI003AB939E4|nr:DUF937 domain-containing protein [Roseiarcaceae bacterium H3SJ34-1]
MFNLNDIIQASHNGQGVQNLANQFGISQAQAQAAIESVLPALSHGLQVKTQDPLGMAQLFTGMANGRGVAAFSDPNAASAPETQQFGNDMLGQIFGSSRATQQVAAHAADTAGVAPETIQQMLPEIMAMVLGGLFKSASNNGLGGILGQLGGMLGQPAPQGGNGGSVGSASPGGSLGDILGQVLQGGLARQGGAAQQPPGAGPQSGGSLGDILGGIFGGNAGGQPPQPGSAAPQGGSVGGGGLADILGQILQGGMAQQGQTSSPGVPAPGSAGGFDPATIQAGIDMFGKMLGHGTRPSPQQQSGLDDMLGQIFGNNRPR